MNTTTTASPLSPPKLESEISSKQYMSFPGDTSKSTVSYEDVRSAKPAYVNVPNQAPSTDATYANAPKRLEHEQQYDRPLPTEKSGQKYSNLPTNFMT